MPGFLVHVGATAICPHGGQVSIISTNTRVLVSSQQVATSGDTFLVAGCAFTVPVGKPQPCIKIMWLMQATRVKVGGQPVILQDSTGLCQSPEQIPQGPPSIIVTQTRVRGV